VSAARVVVLDYGSGNVHSAVRALERAGAEVTLTADRTKVLEADGLLVPGVGAFAAVMRSLRAVRGDEMIEKRLAGGRPVLGICVGQQIMFDEGDEGGIVTEGLAQWPGTVTQLPASVVPHMGWNTVQVAERSRLFAGIEHERFYFVHSYAAQQWSLEVIPPFPEAKVSWSTHEHPFIAAVENGPLMTTQFHPEKSGEPGIALLRNWLGTLGD
jgi:glutamine amidotransferase